MSATEERLAQIRARVEAATEGPWTQGSCLHVQDMYEHRVIHCPDLEQIASLEESRVPEQDAAFIANARSDVPWLLSEVERLRNALAQVATHLWNDQQAYDMTDSNLLVAQKRGGTLDRICDVILDTEAELFDVAPEVRA